MADHFNKLTEAEQERLAILIEECSEVIQVACKILRHGYDSDNKGQLQETNRRSLERELGDVRYIVAEMIDACDLASGKILNAAMKKSERIKPYLHHQCSPK
jgi:MazG nucleotide pyrophosphohydrolase domain